MKTNKFIKDFFAAINDMIAAKKKVEKDNISYMTYLLRSQESANKSKVQAESYDRAMIAMNAIRVGDDADKLKRLRRIIRSEILEGTPKPSTTKYANVAAYIGHESLRPQLNGVYHDRDNKVAVASDETIIMVSPSEYIKECAGRIIAKDGKEIEGRFPDWKSVIQNDDKLTPMVPAMTTEELRDELRQINALLKEACYLQSLTHPMLVGHVEGTPIYTSIKHAHIFLSYGIDGWSSMGHMLKKTTDDGKVIIIMQMVMTESGDDCLHEVKMTEHVCTYYKFHESCFID